MSRRPGTPSRYTCVTCGRVELAMGGTNGYRCAEHRKPVSPQEAAHRTVANAIRRGRLQPPAKFCCADCGKPASQYDHRDYSKPLDVAPVCAGCNVRRGPANGHNARRVGRPVGAYKWQKPAAWRLAQAAQSGFVGADPAGSEVGVVSHAAEFSPREPRNATQSFCGGTRA